MPVRSKRPQPHPGPAAERVLFLRGFIQRPTEVGSIIPSSRFLERRVVRIAEVASAHVVVELGPGTGGTTRALLRAMLNPPARAVTKNPPGPAPGRSSSPAAPWPERTPEPFL